MPNAYTINQKPTSYGQALSLLTEMLAGAGWTYVQSGDGLSSFNTGKVFTNFTSGAANSWNNVRPWARMRDPGGVKEFTFQLADATTGGATNQVRMKFSPAARFTSGGSANTTPSATDERVLLGAGTDASPTFSGWFGSGTVSNPSTVIYQGASLAAAPYGFWFAAQVQGTSYVGGGGGKSATLMLDPVTTVGSDTQPYVIYVDGGNGYTTLSNAPMGRDGGTSSNAAATWTATTGSGFYAYLDAALTSFRAVQPAMYIAHTSLNTPQSAGFLAGGGVTLSSGVLVNPFNGKSEMLPIPYMRTGGAAGSTNYSNNCVQPCLKGWSTMMRWTGHTRLSFMDTLNNKSWICVGNVWLPWDGTTQPMG